MKIRYLSLGLFVLSNLGCAEREALHSVNSWHWGCLDVGDLRRAQPENLNELVAKAKADFALHPIESADEDLEFSRIFQDEENGYKILGLRTLFMSDTEIIYVFDKDDMIIEHFATSTFPSAAGERVHLGSYRKTCSQQRRGNSGDTFPN